MTCRICQSETEGSRGPASGVLRPICTDCATREDNTVLNEVRTYAYMMEQIFEAVDPTPLTTTEIQ